jgi:Predicted permeases
MISQILFKQMIELSGLMVAGYFLEKSRLFHPVFKNDLNIFVLNVTLPCLILSSVFNSTNGSINIHELVISVLILVILLPVAAFLCVKVIPMFKSDKGLYLFMMMYPNVGFIGFPLIKAVFGAESLMNITFINLAFNLSLFTIGILAIGYQADIREKFTWKKLLTPGVIASVAAIFVYAFHIMIPDIICEPITLIGNMTTSLAMLIIGAIAANYSLKEIFCDWKTYLFVAISDVCIPLAFFPLVKLVIADTEIQGITMIILAMPIANGAALFAKKYHCNECLGARTICISTLLSVITIPLVVFLTGIS